MKSGVIIAIVCVSIMAFVGCKPEPDPEIEFGEIYIKVTHRVNWVGYLPDEGAEGRLYNKDSRCRSYLDAVNNVAFESEKSFRSSYFNVADSTGNLQIKDIPIGAYYLVLRSVNNRRYSERIIKINTGETVDLVKNFTNDGVYDEKLEPWDHVVSGDEFSPEEPSTPVKP